MEKGSITIDKSQVYIKSLEASDIYNYMYRGKEIKDNYTGMIPFSLELIKLKSEGLKIKTNRITGKETSDDIINVKFNLKVQTGEFIIRKINEKIPNLTNKIEKYNIQLKNQISKKEIKQLNKTIKSTEEYIEKLKSFVNVIESEKGNSKWNEVKNSKLREMLYKDGFTIEDDKYVVYKRSGSKSRTGQCLFIKESLYKEMINWSRMNLPFIEGMNIDYAGLLAYESLVGSGIESTIKINPKNILIVDDVKSKFKQICNVVRKNDTTGYLDSFTEEYEISNELFDGESLLSSEFFEDGQSMKLLRTHFFKSASFSCHIQKYLKDNCPIDVEFDKWKIKNMYGQYIFAKDIQLICTPTSLKILKFDEDLNMNQKDLWEHWKKTVKTDKCIFGVVKHEKPSKRGTDESGNIIQQTSYQMLNSMPIKYDDMKELTIFEREYINKLKNDDEFFLGFAMNRANTINSNEMLVELAKINKDFINTKIFRDFRTSEICAYTKHCKTGKIRLRGDYCIILGNGMEYLQHSIGKFDINTVDVSRLALKENEIYTKLHADGKDLVCFRNPNTSPSNVLVAKCKYVADIDKYFNLSPQIVCVNAIKFPIQDILSGMDYDSDCMAVFDDYKLLEVAKECYGKYNVCINNVKADKKKYKLTKNNMYVIDNQLAKSQRNIGEVVNLGQLCMSTWHDLRSKGHTEEELTELMKKIDVMTVLSGISIDLAKKLYSIKIEDEIKFVAKTEQLRKLKPNFWKDISQSLTIKNRIESYNCPMDYLNRIMSKLPNPETQKKNIEFTSLLVKHNVKKGDRHQEDKIFNYVKDMCSKINSINAQFKKDTKNTEDEENEEKDILIDNVIKYYNFYMHKLKVKDDTMYAILNHASTNSKILVKLLNVLYTTQKDILLHAFKGK